MNKEFTLTEKIGLSSRMTSDEKSINKNIFECKDMCNERWNEQIKRSKNTKDGDLDDISTISNTNSAQSLISHKLYFDESFKIVGLEIVKATQDENMENDKLVHSFVKPNLNLEENNITQEICSPKIYDNNLNFISGQRSPCKDYENF